MEISVFGIGYVGCVSAACLARDGHCVIGVDRNPEKVRTLLSGKAPVVEPGLDVLTAEAVAAEKLSATSNAQHAVAESNISLICVGTPASSNGSLDTTQAATVVQEIGAALRAKTTYHLVVVRSTVLPGTTEELLLPLLEQSSGSSRGERFGIAYFPEFLREGSAISDFDNPGATILGTGDDRATALLHDLVRKADPRPLLMDIRSAEAVKYANNAWHATKISFANELGSILKSLGVDSHRVFQALCSDKKLNISEAYLTPGFAFGGSCLPKDMRALQHRARTLDVATPLLNGVLEANNNQIHRAYEMVVSAARAGRKIGLVGLSFKAETDDLRISPLVDLAERLIGRGYHVKIFDPIVRLSRLTGANRDYLLSHLPHIADLLMEETDSLINDVDVLVFGNRKAASALLSRGIPNHVRIVDLVRVEGGAPAQNGYQGICW